MQTITIDRIETMLQSYSQMGVDGLPKKSAWTQLISLDSGQPISLINFFKFGDTALYPDGFDRNATDVSGKTAFDRYAAVSGDCLTRAGGRFLLVAPFGSNMMGRDKEWDLVAIGSYPNASSLLSLFEQQEYQAI